MSSSLVGPQYQRYSRLPFFRNRSKRGDCAARGCENAFFKPLQLGHYRCRPKSLIPLATLETRTTTGMRQWSLSPYPLGKQATPRCAIIFRPTARKTAGRDDGIWPINHKSIIQTSGPRHAGLPERFTSIRTSQVRTRPLLKISWTKGLSLAQAKARTPEAWIATKSLKPQQQQSHVARRFEWTFMVGECPTHAAKYSSWR